MSLKIYCRAGIFPILRHNLPIFWLKSYSCEATFSLFPLFLLTTASVIVVFLIRNNLKLEKYLLIQQRKSLINDLLFSGSVLCAYNHLYRRDWLHLWPKRNFWWAWSEPQGEVRTSGSDGRWVEIEKWGGERELFVELIQEKKLLDSSYFLFPKYLR